jgi:hypothetical protein
MTSSRTLLSLLVLLCAAPLHAQQARGPLLLTLPASTRALGLGNAFPVGSADSDAIFYNAAFGDRLRGGGAAVQWFGSRSTGYTASAAMEWWSGGLAVGVRALDYGTDPAVSPAPGPLPGGEGALHGGGAAVASERAASVAFGRTVRGLRLGAAAHLVEQRVSGERNATPAFDVFVGHVLGMVAVGLSAQHLGPGYELAGGDVSLPTRLTLAASGVQAAPMGPVDVLPVLSLGWEVDGGMVPAGGVEVSYWPVQGRTFTLRLGGRSAAEGVRPFTAGAGFTGDRLIIDYALVPLEGGRFSHRAGLRWR